MSQALTHSSSVSLLRQLVIASQEAALVTARAGGTKKATCNHIMGGICLPHLA